MEHIKIDLKYCGRIGVRFCFEVSFSTTNRPNFAVCLATFEPKCIQYQPKEPQTDLGDFSCMTPQARDKLFQQVDDMLRIYVDGRLQSITTYQWIQNDDYVGD